MTNKLKILIAAIFLMSFSARADEGWSAGPGGMGDEPPPHREGGGKGGKGAKEGRGEGHGGGGNHADMQACATELGLSAPTAGTKPSDSDREKMMACMKTKRDAEKTAMTACLTAAGITFDLNGKPTSRPSKEVMDSCRASGTTATATTSATATSTATDTATDSSTVTDTTTGVSTSAI